MLVRFGIRAFALVLVTCTAASALTKDEIKCVAALNKDGAAVGQTQGKENLACLKAAGKADLTGTAEACLTADAKGKVAKKTEKTTADEAKLCGDAPDFAYTSAATVNTVARQAELDLVEDVFGPDLDAAVASCATSAKACKCQNAVLGSVEKLAKAERAAFLKCKKVALATADGAEDVAACVVDVATAKSIAAERQPGGKIAKESLKLAGAITKKCDAPMVTGGAFPGACTGLTGSTLHACLDARIACRVCESLGAADGLVVDCDAFDDGVDNASCAALVCAPGSVASCYSGPVGTAGIGSCTAGAQVCDASGTGFGSCTGEVVPTTDVCGNALDDDCDGVTDQGCICIPGSTAPCYTGPPGTLNVGICTAGSQTCDASGMSYGSCTGQVGPTTDACGDGLDNDCNGVIDDGCLGDRVWNDLNANGLQNPGEPGIGGATLILRTDLGALVSVAVSGSGTGTYWFTGIPAGNYYVEVIPPFSYAITPKDVGGDDTLDGDFDPSSGATDIFSFSGSRSDIDCGVRFVVP